MQNNKRHGSAPQRSIKEAETLDNNSFMDIYNYPKCSHKTFLKAYAGLM